MPIVQGDARDLSHIPDASIQVSVTSPPYPEQRAYGDDPREIGRVRTFAEYVSQMREVADALRPKLTDDGTWWLNIGHKSTRSGGAGGDYNPGGEKEGKPRFGKFADMAYAERQIVDVAYLVGEALRKDGWRWVTTIVWDKDGTLERQDERHIRRPRLAHESILMLCPMMERQKYHPDPTVPNGTIWRIKPGGAGTGHLAPFPAEIPRRAILLSSDPGDHVLDQFSGEHTTVRVAESLGRVGHGVELYADA